MLLRSLCECLPYGLVCAFYDEKNQVYHDAVLITVTKAEFKDFGGTEVIDIIGQSTIVGDNTRYVYSLQNVKPYLRSMNTITEKEFDELSEVALVDSEGMPGDITEYVDWMNARFFDRRGLIGMGLAFEAPEGMYGK